MPRLLYLALASAVLAAACGETAAPRTASQVLVVSGGGQSAAVATSLPAPVVVQVNDQDGKPMSGTAVSFSVGAGAGSVSASSVSTDGSGQAQVNWTLGTQAGSMQLSASAGSATATVTATANPGPPSSLEATAGNGQTAMVGQALTTPLAVLVKDAHGNAVPAVPVIFTPATGDGTVSAPSVATNGEGRAQATWTLGGRAGQQALSARVSTITAPLAFTATATPGAASALAPVTPPPASATVGQTLPLTVRVTDAHGNGIPGTTVSFGVASGGGAVTPSVVTSGADGQVLSTWTLGTTAGAQRATATAAGLAGASIAFDVTAAAGAAASLALALDSVALSLGDTLRAVPTARDQFNNTTALPQLTWTTASSGVATVDASGLIRAAGPGTTTVTAHIPTLPGVNASMKVTVAPVAAALELTIAGLPGGAPGNVTVRGPGNFTRVVTQTGLVALPAAGQYTVEANDAIISPFVFAGAPATQNVSIAAGQTATATVTYARRVTQLQNDVPVSVSSTQGLYRDFRIAVPAGASSLTVATTGANGDVDIYVQRGTFPSGSTFSCFSQQDGSNDSCTVNMPQAGDYYILLHAYEAYTNVSLRASYVAGGTMAFSVTGLPAGAAPSISVSGPNAYTASVTSTASLTGLLAGTYTLLANTVAHQGKVYAPAPSSQQVTVTGGQTTNVAIAYAETQGGFNLDIAGMYVTQATQTMAGGVPLIAGRNGLLRVFVRGSLANTAIPDVRVRVYRNGQLMDTRILSAPASSTPTLVDEGVLATSWNYLMPGSLIQPGLAIVADVDVNNVVQETNENDNVFPSNGTPLALDVRTTVPFQARLVPVLQPNGQVGDVTEANKNTYTDFANALYPLPSIDADVRAPYSFNAMLPAAYDTVWSRLLNEIRLLRGADGSSRHYYGVFKPSYSGGGTGLGYIGLPAAIGVDWDFGSSGSGGTSWRAMTAAHEWGHNFGRAHVGCPEGSNGPANPDVNYPYGGGRLGLHGWDMRTNEIRTLSSYFDLMSYCLPYWSSDYTYNAVMNFRGQTGGITTAAPQPSLLVWGRTLPDGSVVLEPAFEVSAPPSLPSKSGRYRLAALDDTGATLLDMSFDGDEVDHMEGVRHFSFIIPLSRLGGRDAALLRVSGGRQDAVQRRAPAAAMEAGARIDEVKVTRTSGNRVRLQWDVARSPMVLVRDPRTGAVLSFARGGDQLIAVPGTEVELNMSDGVKSTTRRVQVQQ